jgi:iron complex transport system substrate-binding protein
MKKLFLLLLFLIHPFVFAQIDVVDDSGQHFIFASPPKRIITLSPHATELVFNAGAGERIVGTTRFSNYPRAAQSIPLIGDIYALDIEKIITLKPDIIIFWNDGNPKKQIEQLQKLPFPLFNSSPRTLYDIPHNIKKLGKLFHTESIALPQSQQLAKKIKSLQTHYQNQTKLRVFYQVWDKPLYTLGKRHIFNDILTLCGGVNIFNQIDVLSPIVNTEDVIHANPDVIFSGKENIAFWAQFPNLNAVKKKHIFTLPNDSLARPGPRMIDGAYQVCQQLSLVRK